MSRKSYATCEMDFENKATPTINIPLGLTGKPTSSWGSKPFFLQLDGFTNVMIVGRKSFTKRRAEKTDPLLFTKAESSRCITKRMHRYAMFRVFSRQNTTARVVKSAIKHVPWPAIPLFSSLQASIILKDQFSE